MNNLKNKCKAGDNVVFKKVGRPNLLDQNIVKKVKDIAIGTRQAGGVINRRQIINIARGVVRSNNPDILAEFGGTVELTNRWARNILSVARWNLLNFLLKKSSLFREQYQLQYQVMIFQTSLF